MLHCEWKGDLYPVVWWKGEKIGNTYALDTETELIVEEQTPDMILGQAFDGKTAYLFHANQTEDFLNINLHEQSRVFLQNFKFDMEVTDKQTGRRNWYEHVDSGRVLDIGIQYRLVRLAQMGLVPRKYSLAEMSDKLFGVTLNKDPLIRTTFGDGHLTDEHLIYAAQDAVATYFIAKSVMAQTYQLEKNGKRKFLGHRLQMQADLVLGDMMRRPLHVDVDRAKSLKRAVEREMMEQTIELVKHGYNPNMGKGTKSRYNGVIRPILEEAGLEIRETEKGDVSQSGDYLMPVYEHPFVRSFLEYQSNQKLISTFLKPLVKSKGIIRPRYELLMATGRTSSNSPNIQQQPRKGNVRGCIIPAPGNVFIGADYSYVELCTLAQWLYFLYGGERELCRVINSGLDPHYVTASKLLGKSIKHVTRDERQAAKALNFGIPGGLSEESLRGYAKLTYGVDLTETEAKEWRTKWMRVLYPDVGDYLETYGSEVTMPSGRIRSKCSFTVFHNTPFQALAADGIKTAMHRLYRDNQLPISIMVHDELIAQAQKASGYNDVAKYLSDMMVGGMQEVCPNVRISAEAYVMERWIKDAEPVYDGDKLICFTEAMAKEK